MIVFFSILGVVLLSCGWLSPDPLPNDQVKEAVKLTMTALAQVEPPDLHPTADAATQPPPPTHTPDEDPLPVPTSTATSLAAVDMPGGQIAFFQGDTLYRYLSDRGQILPVISGLEVVVPRFTGGRFLQFSPCGRYLGLTLESTSMIIDLETDARYDLQHLGDFFAWQGEGAQFYAVWGMFIDACFLDQLDEQDQFEFEILLVDLADLDHPATVATVPGELRYLWDVSLDGAYASVLLCACFTVCGSQELWQLDTMTVVPSLLDEGFEEYDFSPDNHKMAISYTFVAGYTDSPIYVAGRDYSDLRQVFYQPEVVPLYKTWCPNSQWIAFNALDFIPATGEYIDDCVMLVRYDGAELIEVACGFAELAAWSPEGDQLLYRLEDALWVYDLAEGGHTSLPIESDARIELFAWGRLP